jgi:hypothetical protein
MTDGALGPQESAPPTTTSIALSTTRYVHARLFDGYRP